MAKLHLVDGTYELFRAFYSPAADDRPLAAVRGLVRSLLALLRQPDVTHVACAFDSVIESFRHQLFAGDTTGEGLDPELAAQFAPAERATRALGITVWPMVEFEADDALATAAARFAGDDRLEQVVVCSPDKDLTQCVVGQRVVCFDRARGRLFDEEGVIQKLGVLPASVPDFLALVGDTADGIPGVRRWGARSAGAVLRHYGHLEAIPLEPARWDAGLAGRVRGAKSLCTSLEAARDQALLYRVLATLRRDVPLLESLDDLFWRGVPRGAFAELTAELGSDYGERVPRFA